MEAYRRLAAVTDPGRRRRRPRRVGGPLRPAAAAGGRAARRRPAAGRVRAARHPRDHRAARHRAHRRARRCSESQKVRLRRLAPKAVAKDDGEVAIPLAVPPAEVAPTLVALLDELRPAGRRPSRGARASLRSAMKPSRSRRRRRRRSSSRSSVVAIVVGGGVSAVDLLAGGAGARHTVDGSRSRRRPSTPSSTGFADSSCFAQPTAQARSAGRVQGRQLARPARIAGAQWLGYRVERAPTKQALARAGGRPSSELDSSAQGASPQGVLESCATRSIDELTRLQASLTSSSRSTGSASGGPRRAAQGAAQRST